MSTGLSSFFSPRTECLPYIPCVWNQISHRLVCVLQVAVVVRSAGPCFRDPQTAVSCLHLSCWLLHLWLPAAWQLSWKQIWFFFICDDVKCVTVACSAIQVGCANMEYSNITDHTGCPAAPMTCCSVGHCVDAGIWVCFWFCILS